MFAVVSLFLARLAVSLALAGAPCLLTPVHGNVTDPFRQPGCSFCPGNRGIEYATAPGAAVIAAAGGVVTFAGPVAGVRYVVVDHGGGYRTTYGRLAAISVAVGSAVRAGQTVGAAGPATFFGLRLGEVYLDPAPHLAKIVPQPRLVPLDGRARRPPPPQRLSC
jgi:murein DD-endopeptidase MepM/ murein hydrolase activator NlpD